MGFSVTNTKSINPSGNQPSVGTRDLLRYINLGTGQDRNVSLGTRSQAYFNEQESSNDIGFNVGIGFECLFLNKSSQFNVAIGHECLRGSSTGYYNALDSETYINSDKNVAIGYHCGQFIGNGADNNVLIGYECGFSDSTNKFTGSSNVFMGYQSGRTNTTGYENVGIGAQNLYSNTTGYQNVAIGKESLFNNTTGSRNMFIGYKSGFNNTTGSGNMGFGIDILFNNNSGSNNIGIGISNLYNNISGSYNIAIGEQSLYKNESGNHNVMVGHKSGFSNTNGNDNVGIGFECLFSNTSSQFNVAIGYECLRGSSTGEYNESDSYNNSNKNVAIGYHCGQFIGNGADNNVLIGYECGFSDSTNKFIGSSNVFMGYQSGRTNTTGDDNVGIGAKNLYSNTTGSNNVGIGASNLYSNTTGSNNVAVGKEGLNNNTDGENNVMVGFQSGFTNTSGNDNVGIGAKNLYSNTTGSNNVGIGASNLYSNTTGSNNVAVGKEGLYFNDSGENNVMVGFQSGYNNISGDDNVGIGAKNLYSNTTGSNNVAVGKEGLNNNINGRNNVMVGYKSGFTNTSGNDNVGIGAENLYSNITGSNNIAIGSKTLFGDNLNNSFNINDNIAIGNNSGQYIGNSSNNNILIGKETGKSNEINNSNPVYIQEGLSLNINDILSNKEITCMDVSIDGDNLVVGFPYSISNNGERGAVKIFKKVNSEWEQNGNTIFGNSQDNNFGYHVKINKEGNVIFVGIPNDSNNQGQIKIYTKYFTEEWIEISSFDGNGDGSYLGKLFSINKNNFNENYHIQKLYYTDSDNLKFKKYIYPNLIYPISANLENAAYTYSDDFSSTSNLSSTIVLELSKYEDSDYIISYEWFNYFVYKPIKNNSNEHYKQYNLIGYYCSKITGFQGLTDSPNYGIDFSEHDKIIFKTLKYFKNDNNNKRYPNYQYNKYVGNYLNNDIINIFHMSIIEDSDLRPLYTNIPYFEYKIGTEIQINKTTCNLNSDSSTNLSSDKDSNNINFELGPININIFINFSYGLTNSHNFLSVHSNLNFLHNISLKTTNLSTAENNTAIKKSFSLEPYYGTSQMFSRTSTNDILAISSPNSKILNYNTLDSPALTQNSNELLGNVMKYHYDWLVTNTNTSGDNKIKVYYDNNLICDSDFGINQNGFGHDISINDSTDSSEIFFCVSNIVNKTVYLFKANNDEVEQGASVSNNVTSFGHSIDFKGNYLLVGAPKKSNNKGNVYLYELNSDLLRFKSTTPITIYNNFSSISGDNFIGSSVIYVNKEKPIAELTRRTSPDGNNWNQDTNWYTEQRLDDSDYGYSGVYNPYISDYYDEDDNIHNSGTDAFQYFKYTTITVGVYNNGPDNISFALEDIDSDMIIVKSKNYIYVIKRYQLEIGIGNSYGNTYQKIVEYIDLNQINTKTPISLENDTFNSGSSLDSDNSKLIYKKNIQFFDIEENNKIYYDVLGWHINDELFFIRYTNTYNMFEKFNYYSVNKNDSPIIRYDSNGNAIYRKNRDYTWLNMYNKVIYAGQNISSMDFVNIGNKKSVVAVGIESYNNNDGIVILNYIENNITNIQFPYKIPTNLLDYLNSSEIIYVNDSDFILYEPYYKIIGAQLKETDSNVGGNNGNNTIDSNNYKIVFNNIYQFKTLSGSEINIQSGTKFGSGLASSNLDSGNLYIGSTNFDNLQGENIISDVGKIELFNFSFNTQSYVELYNVETDNNNINITQLPHQIIGNNDNFGHLITLSSNGSRLAVVDYNIINNQINNSTIYIYNIQNNSLNYFSHQLIGTIQQSDFNLLLTDNGNRRVYVSSVDFNNEGTILTIGIYYYNSNSQNNNAILQYKYISDNNWVLYSNNFGYTTYDGTQLNSDEDNGARDGFSCVLTNYDSKVIAGSYIYNWENAEIGPAAGFNNESLLGDVIIYNNSITGIATTNLTNISNTDSNTELSLDCNKYGDLVVLGNPDESSNEGNVKIFEDNAGTDSQNIGDSFTEIYSENGNSNNYFGLSVSFNDSGNYLAIGSSNTNNVKIYYTDNTWESNNNTSITNIYNKSYVKLSSVGDLLAIGHPTFNNNSGKIKVYEKYNTNSWKIYDETNDIDGIIENDNYSKNMYIYSLTSNDSSNIITASSNSSIREYKKTINFNLGNSNVYIGNQSGFSNITGKENVGIGINNFYNNISSSRSVAIGYQNSYNLKNKIGNVSIGFRCLYGIDNDNNLSNIEEKDILETYNIAIGYECLFNNSFGGKNVAIGTQTLANSTLGDFNIAIGYKSFYNNISGSSNIVIGYDAGIFDDYSKSNIISIGNHSGFGLTVNEYDVIIGNNNSLEHQLIKGNTLNRHWSPAENGKIDLGNKEQKWKDFYYEGKTIIGKSGDFIENQIKSISARNHSMILLNTGKVLSFGNNSFGQLGDGTNDSSNEPVAVSITADYNGENAIASACGIFHSLILLNTGKILSFGSNFYGQLGNGSNINSIVPIAVSTTAGYNGSNAIAIAGGSRNSLILLNTGKVLSFGRNNLGQLGDGSTVDSSNIPVEVSTTAGYDGSNAIAITCGLNHSMILLNTGKVLSFGDNDYGQLGDESTDSRNEPVEVDSQNNGFYNGENAIAIACGTNHSMILLNTGKVLSFGKNDVGQLGDRSNDSRTSPVAVNTGGRGNITPGYDGSNAIAISCGKNHSMILLNTGKVVSFGDDQFGQLGDGSNITGQSIVPIAVSTTAGYDGLNAIAIAGGYEHSMILLNTGKVLSFGDNDYGQLGDGSTDSRNEPVEVDSQNSDYNGSNVKTIYNSFAIDLNELNNPHFEIYENRYYSSLDNQDKPFNGFNHSDLNIKKNGSYSSINFLNSSNEKQLEIGLNKVKINGNVGIGTTNPTCPLDVATPSSVVNTIWNPISSYSSMDDATTDNGFMFSLKKKSTNLTNGFWGLKWEGGTNNDNNVALYMHDNDSLTTTIHQIGKFQNNSQNSTNEFFTGQHRNILNKNIDETYVGLIVSSTGQYINVNNSLKPSINESLPVCNITNTDNDIKVFGVISDKEDNNDNRSIGTGCLKTIKIKTNKNEQRLHINSLGEGAVWVCNKNGNLVNGDYISSSSVSGYGQKQILQEGTLKNYTVAKITCDCDFSLNKIVKQKLKVIITTKTYEETKTINIQNIDYDENGDVQFEDDLDENGNQQMIYPLDTRFLLPDATQITEEEYNVKLEAGEEVYIACFVGCTYHCG